MIFWRFVGILFWVCSPEEDIDRRDEGLRFIEDPLDSIASYKGCCNIRDILPKSKEHAHLVVTCGGYQFREMVKSCS